MPIPEPDLTGTATPNAGAPSSAQRSPSWRASVGSVVSATSFVSAATSAATVKAATARYIGRMGEMLADSDTSRRTYEQALMSAQHEAFTAEAGERRLSVRCRHPPLPHWSPGC